MVNPARNMESSRYPPRVKLLHGIEKSRVSRISCVSTAAFRGENIGAVAQSVLVADRGRYYPSISSNPTKNKRKQEVSRRRVARRVDGLPLLWAFSHREAVAARLPLPWNKKNLKPELLTPDKSVRSEFLFFAQQVSKSATSIKPELNPYD